VKRFLRELELRLAGLSPDQREEVAKAYQQLINGVRAATSVISGHFRPSKMAALGLLTELLGAMSPGGGEKFVAKLRADAPKVGPHVTAFVSAL
jgi:hypothetical protein